MVKLIVIKNGNCIYNEGFETIKKAKKKVIAFLTNSNESDSLNFLIKKDGEIVQEVIQKGLQL